MSDELPEGWASIQVGELLILVNGYPFKPRQWSTKGLPIVRIQNLNNHDASFNHCNEAIPEKFRVRSGDLLFAWSGTPGTSFGAHIWNGGDAWLNQHIFRVEFAERFIDKRFLRHAINQNLDDYIHQAHGGAGLAHITKGKFEASSVQIPPLAEQQRIVAKVEQLLSRVNAARQRLSKAPAILKRFRQSVLAAACSGRLTAGWRGEHTSEVSSSVLSQLRQSNNGVKTRRGVPSDVQPSDEVANLEMPPNWELASVAELLRIGALVDVKDGNHGANHPKVADFTTEGLPFITAAQVNDFKIDYDTAYRVAGKVLAKLRVGFSEPKDAILTHKGSVGRSALNARKCVLTPQTTYYRCRADAISSEYLVYYFASLQCYVQLAAVMSQTTRDFVPISEQYRLFLILPPLAEQHEIVRRVEALFKLADAIEKRVAAATVRADKLTQAILAKAFRGELVPTEAELARREGRDYEPASVLLERVKKEKEASTGANQPRRRTVSTSRLGRGRT